ncbi:hypothetical protein [Streptomyces sp. NPDC049879]|uniref:hypothetical protein n=1 Tax=Streptomyces sp. NPDC049879 TaxID=3365598 RepID=UPI00379275F1
MATYEYRVSLTARRKSAAMSMTPNGDVTGNVIMRGWHPQTYATHAEALAVVTSGMKTAYLGEERARILSFTITAHLVGGHDVFDVRTLATYTIPAKAGAPLDVLTYVYLSELDADDVDEAVAAADRPRIAVGDRVTFDGATGTVTGRTTVQYGDERGDQYVTVDWDLADPRGTGRAYLSHDLELADEADDDTEPTLEDEPMPYADPEAAKNWTAPKPVQLPDIRRKLIAWHQSRAATQHQGMLIRNGRGTLAPYMPDRPFMAAEVMGAQEADRLSQARLFFVNGPMTAVANRKAARPRPAPLTKARVPSPYGLVVFQDPVGSYVSHGNGSGPMRKLDRTAPATHIPYVAVSWGIWRADFAPTNAEPTPAPPGVEHDGPAWVPYGGPSWVQYSGDTQGLILPPSGDEPDRFWVTGYTPWNHAPEGRPALHWDTEGVVQLGHEFDHPAERGTGEVFMRAMIAAWDLITQEEVTGQPVVDVDLVERAPKKSRQDHRRGIVDDGDVSVVSVTARRKRKVPRRRNPAAAGTGTPYTHRRWIPEHDRNHCMDPHKHRETIEAGERCHHEPITILDHWAGDESLPVSDAVTLVDGPRGG